MECVCAGGGRRRGGEREGWCDGGWWRKTRREEKFKKENKNGETEPREEIFSESRMEEGTNCLYPAPRLGTRPPRHPPNGPLASTRPAHLKNPARRIHGRFRRSGDSGSGF